MTLKGLRHTHATLLLELGEHPKVVQERLGHSAITTTMNIYGHVTPTMQKSAIDRFAAHLGETSAAPSLCAVNLEPLPDRWHTRDFPVLMEAARLLDNGEATADSDAIAEVLGWDEDSIMAALAALTSVYATSNTVDSLGRPTGYFVRGIPARGRRAVGLRP